MRPWRTGELACCLALALGGAGSVCLDGAVPPATRLGIDSGNGTLVLVGIFDMSWDSSLLVSQVAHILIQEMLGYNTTVSGTGATSASGLYAVAGCRYPNNFNNFQLAGCGGNNTFLSHITMEVWGVSKIATMQALLAPWPNIIPENLGSVGYVGDDGMFVWEDLANQAYSLEGLPLDAYRGYDAKWHEPWKYFDNYTALNLSDLRPCNETGLTSTAEMTNYLQVTGDSKGVVPTPDGLQGRCWLGRFWFSPACRDTPERCILYLTGSTGWGMFDFMQRVSYYRMPFALAVARTSALYTSLSHALRVVPYWFRPDSAFVEHTPQMVQFPPANPDEQAKGIRLTNAGNTVISKWVHPNMKSTHIIYDFVSLFSMPMHDIEAMMLDKKINASDSYTEVACRWVRNRRAAWQAWIPLSTSCVAGQGLVDPAGAFVGQRPAAKSCDWCPEGWRSVELKDSVGPTHVCERCPPGTSQGRPGQSSCTPCAAGTFSAAAAAAGCARCAVAWYQDSAGSSACRACPEPKTTLFLAAAGPSDCVCPAGMYQPLGANLSCASCPEGMVCPAPNSSEAAIPLPGAEATPFPFPQAAAHYMTRPGAPLAAYLCRTSELCPGGRPGTCSAGHDPAAVACGRCLPGTYESTERDCERCQGNELAIFVSVAVVGGLGVLAALTYTINGDVLRQPRATTAMLIIAGLSFSCLQTLGVFNDIAVRWAEPLKSIFYTVSLLSFDLRFMKVECAVGGNGVNKYVMQVLVAPVGAIFILIILGVKKLYINRWVRFRAEAVNTIGSLYSLFFISIAITVLVPFVCYKHPGGQGWSLVQNPSILCFNGGYHTTMVAAGLVATCVVLLPFVALVAYGTLGYSRFLQESTADGGVHLQMFRFLYFRYRPEAYYFSLLTLARSLGLCLVPVVIRDSGAMQVVALAALLQGFAVVQLLARPWRSEAANVIDGIIATMMVLMLVCSCMVSDFTNADETAGVLGSIIFGVLVGCVCAVLLYSLYQRLLKRARFEFFVSHHKADAATQARFLQLLLQRRCGREVFIDSDYLTDLDTLFDIVRGSVRWLVVLLTSDTLRRPWCAGEIAVACGAHRRIKVVKTGSFEPPREEELQDIGRYLHGSETSLQELGVSAEDIATSYRYLLSSEVPVVELMADRRGRRRFEDAAAALLGVPPRVSDSSRAASAKMLIVCCDPEDDEAVSAAGIIVMKMQEAVMDKVHSGVYMLPENDLPESDLVETMMQAYAIVVVLSRGTMQCTQQLQVMFIAGAEDLAAVPVSTPSFRFPDDSYYGTTLASMVLQEDEVREVAAALQHLFRRIAVFLATAASGRVIEAQVAEVVSRLPGAGRARSTAKTSLVQSGRAARISLFGGNSSASGLSAGFSTADLPAPEDPPSPLPPPPTDFVFTAEHAMCV